MPRSEPEPPPAAVAMPDPETTPTASSSSTLDDIMKDLREQYEKDESLRPFMKKLEGKTTAAEISAVFRGQVKEYNSAPYDKLMNSLNPVINVLCASSSVIGAGVGLVFSPASVIFAGADALLSAANGVIASYNALTVVFEHIGNFFHRLEKNTEKPTMEAIKDVIVDTMAEVLKIFAFMTKEVKLGRTMRFLKNFARDLIGKAVIQDALSKLDRLTQEGVNRVIEHVSNTTDRIESNVGAALGELRVVHRELGPISQNIDWLVKDGQERKTREDEEKGSWFFSPASLGF
ncbi:hypothetical protein EI94DRAFT_387423 [Lactarius quietus]|nr:hypothetical protein EI94DRAFT_387423 [Lactarius quietus]